MLKNDNMKNLKVIVSLMILLILVSCSKGGRSKLVDPSNEVTFQIQKIKEGDSFTTSIASFEISNRSAGWNMKHDGRIQLTREIEIDLKLENGYTIDFGFWFIKYEDNADDLILEDEDLYPGKRNWDYISTEDERKNFYQDFDEARVILNYNYIFNKEINSNFEVISVQPAIIDGKEKSFVTINFEGEAYGLYDPTGEFQGIYQITNGIFRGVIE